MTFPILVEPEKPLRESFERGAGKDMPEVAAAPQPSALLHDLNNLLGVIVGYSELVGVELAQQGGALSDDLSEIRWAADRAATLVDELAKLNAGAAKGRGAVSRRVPVRAPLALDHAIWRWQRRLSMVLGPQTELRLQLDGADRCIPCTCGELQDILLNLAINARDAMPEGGAFEVRTRVEKAGSDEWICLEVSDDGSGMPPGVAQRVFEDGYTTKPHGQGIGLANVARTLQSAGGCVSVSSREGEGTCFSLIFPVISEG